MPGAVLPFSFVWQRRCSIVNVPQRQAPAAFVSPQSLPSPLALTSPLPARHSSILSPRPTCLSFSGSVGACGVYCVSEWCGWHLVYHGSLLGQASSASSIVQRSGARPPTPNSKLACERTIKARRLGAEMTMQSTGGQAALLTCEKRVSSRVAATLARLESPHAPHAR